MRSYMKRLFLLLICLSIRSIAQDRAAIIGTVTDRSGALVAGASVELKTSETGLRRSTSTSAQGLYEITPLPVGSYSITITKAGFKPTTVERIDLQYGDTRTIDARLEIGGATEIVEVTAAADVLNRTNAEVGGVIESAQIKEI